MKSRRAFEYRRGVKLFGIPLLRHGDFGANLKEIGARGEIRNRVGHNHKHLATK